jgi:hypothetical protein
MPGDTPSPRKVIALLTDAEWRAVRMAAAANDTSIQGYVTTVLLAKLQGDDRQHLDAATR